MHQFGCHSSPWKRGMAAWDCKFSSLVAYCASFSCPGYCPGVTFHVEHSLEDTVVCGYTSTSIPFLFLALALCPCWWSNLSIFSSLHEVNRVGRKVLSCSHTHMYSKAIWVGTAKSQMIGLSLKALLWRKLKWVIGKDSTRRFWYVIASHSTLSECSKYRMSQNVLLTLGQSYC